jgi:hypothetical protein
MKTGDIATFCIIIIIAVMVTTLFLAIPVPYKSEITESHYDILEIEMLKYPSIRPLIKDSMDDDKITYEEYNQIESKIKEIKKQKFKEMLSPFKSWPQHES